MDVLGVSRTTVTQSSSGNSTKVTCSSHAKRNSHVKSFVCKRESTHLSCAENVSSFFHNFSPNDSLIQCRKNKPFCDPNISEIVTSNHDNDMVFVVVLVYVPSSEE